MDSLKSQNNLKISELKINLQKIITNIEALERVEAGSHPTNSHKIECLKRETEQLLEQAESIPFKKIKKIIKKRKVDRKISKSKPKSKAKQNVTSSKQESTPTFSGTTTATKIRKYVNTSAQSKKPDVQLRSYYEAQRFLRTFELLKMLHYTRCRASDKTQEFSIKLNNVRNIWQQILEENQPLRTQECEIEDQWNEVLFGPSEQTYYTSAPKLSDFIQIRRTWDSYIVNNAGWGSSIPRGWITPAEEVSVEWSKYRTN